MPAVAAAAAPSDDVSKRFPRWKGTPGKNDCTPQQPPRHQQSEANNNSTTTSNNNNTHY
jgi:hypothetical protein